MNKTNGAKILVADDEEDPRVLLRYMLEPAGYVIRAEGNGREALKTFFSWRPDLVLLDVLMPKMNGWELLERIREVSDAPVIMVTALGQDEEKVRGLKCGADDYVVKPFTEAELLARVQAVLRRGGRSCEPTVTYTDERIQVDFQHHRTFVNGSEVKLSPLEFRILGTLVQNSNQVLSPERLLDLCWGDRPGGLVNVRVYIGFLRRKLEEDPARPQLIETVREVGYRYRPPRHVGE